MIEQLSQMSVFHVTLTVVMLLLSQELCRRVKHPLMSPLILAIVGIIVVLKVLHIDLALYESGSTTITFFLGPVTVALAVPLYHQLDNLKRHMMPILLGILLGSAVSVLSTMALGAAFGLSRELVMSLSPKSTTTAIAVELSSSFGGISALTVAFVIFAGTLGNVVGEPLFRALKVKHPTSKGVALGTASHAFGTNRALEMGPTEGAMSSLSIGVAGLMTTFLLPLLVNFYDQFF